MASVNSVLVGHRDDGHADAGEARDVGRVHATRVHDDLGRGSRDARRPPRRSRRPRGHARHRWRPPAHRCRIVAPPARAPAASARARPLGSSQPSVGSQAAPRTPSGESSGKRSWASRAEISVQGQPERASPGHLAPQLVEPLGRAGEPERAHLVPAWVHARLRAQAAVELASPASSSGSAQTELRSWPTSPAEWKVEPEVSSARSSRTTSRQPRLTRW